MTIDEQWQELGRRAVACKAWRWIPGMQHDRRNDDRVVSVLPFVPTDDECDGCEGCIRVTRKQWAYTDWGLGLQHDPFPWLPDLRDPATVGCLLALVREAWGDPAICIVEEHRDWWARLNGLPLCAFADTEAEALVAALEAAP